MPRRCLPPVGGPSRSLVGMHLGAAVAASLVLALAVALAGPLDHGPVVIGDDGDRIDDWADVQLWLPAAQARLAEPVLASFTVG
jgi:hypothetical protein